MSAAALAMVVLLGLSAGIALALPERESAGQSAGAERAAASVLGFFGVGGVPLALSLAVLFSTGAIAMTALELIANLHFGPAYPAWFPVHALASGLGIGLLCTRVLAAAYPANRAEHKDPAKRPYVGLP